MLACGNLIFCGSCHTFSILVNGLPTFSVISFFLCKFQAKWNSHRKKELPLDSTDNMCHVLFFLIHNEDPVLDCAEECNDLTFIKGPEPYQVLYKYYLISVAKQLHAVTNKNRIKNGILVCLTSLSG